MKLVTDNIEKKEVIKVIGLGGAGSNAVDYMARKYQSTNVHHICANTDSSHLGNLKHVDHRINLGTEGLGAGMNIHIGEKATRESESEIRNAISGADMLFLAAGMGGGTGTGAIAIVAEIAKEMGILTVAVVSKPFSNEGKRKMLIANEGIEKLLHQVNSLIILPNDRLIDTLEPNILGNILKAFEASNDVLANSVNAITDIIGKIGHINIDFEDIRTAMSIAGQALISSAEAKGNNRAIKAVQSALCNPLVEEIKLTNARGVLVNITSSTIALPELGDIESYMEKYTHPDADIIKVGMVYDNDFADTIKVTVILTGLEPTDKINSLAPNTKEENALSAKNPQLKETVTLNMEMPKNLSGRDIPAYLRNHQNQEASKQMGDPL